MEPKFSIKRSNDFCNESDVSDITAVSTSYLLCVLVGCLSVLVMCGNLLVIISIIYFKQLHTPTNYLILSLAVADLLVGVFVLPFTIMLTAYTCWYLGDLLCKVRGSFDMILCTCSILNLCCIAIDRYYAVCQPLSYRTKINACVIVIMILVSWIVSALIAIGIIIQGFNQGQSTKCFVFERTSTSLRVASFAFYLPVIVMCSIYLKIFMVAQRQACRIHNTKSRATVSKMERKATKTLAIVMGIFIICWTPFFCSMTLYHMSNIVIPLSVMKMFKCLGWSNSMLNPFVYAFFYSWFRSSFRMIISGKIFQGDFTNCKLSCSM